MSEEPEAPATGRLAAKPEGNDIVFLSDPNNVAHPQSQAPRGTMAGPQRAPAKDVIPRKQHDLNRAGDKRKLIRLQIASCVVAALSIYFSALFERPWRATELAITRCVWLAACQVAAVVVCFRVHESTLEREPRHSIDDAIGSLIWGVLSNSLGFVLIPIGSLLAACAFLNTWAILLHALGLRLVSATHSLRADKGFRITLASVAGITTAICVALASLRAAASITAAQNLALGYFVGAPLILIAVTLYLMAVVTMGGFSWWTNITQAIVGAVTFALIILDEERFRDEWGYVAIAIAKAVGGLALGGSLASWPFLAIGWRFVFTTPYWNGPNVMRSPRPAPRPTQGGEKSVSQ